jgi:hypothetical protein
MSGHPPGRTILGTAYYGGPQLVTDNVRSFEWESFARREPRRARERLGPLKLPNAVSKQMDEP